MELDHATDLVGDASHDGVFCRPGRPTKRDGAARFGRRSFLSLALSGTAALTLGSALSACGAASSDRSGAIGATGTARPAPHRAGKALLVYFSRAGENYWYGGRRNLRVGNTEIVAGMIHSRLHCDTYRIEAADPYPADYEETVERNVREQDEDARPQIANPLASIARYDTVLLGSPIWNVRPPMIMQTFTDSHDSPARRSFRSSPTP